MLYPLTVLNFITGLCFPKAVTVKKSHHTFVFWKWLMIVQKKKKTIVQDRVKQSRKTLLKTIASKERLNSSLIQQGQLWIYRQEAGLASEWMKN